MNDTILIPIDGGRLMVVRGGNGKTGEGTLQISISMPSCFNTHPRALAQLHFLEASIQSLLTSAEYQDGKLRASLSTGLDGANQEIGLPPSIAMMHETFNRLVVGHFRPELGLLSLNTYTALDTQLAPHLKFSYTGLFRDARIETDSTIPDGFVRWFYPVPLRARTV